MNSSDSLGSRTHNGAMRICKKTWNWELQNRALAYLLCQTFARLDLAYDPSKRWFRGSVERAIVWLVWFILYALQTGRGCLNVGEVEIMHACACTVVSSLCTFLYCILSEKKRFPFSLCLSLSSLSHTHT